MSQPRIIIYAPTKGVLISKNENEAFSLLDKVASNNYQWLLDMLNPNKVSRVCGDPYSITSSN